ncbi:MULTISPECIES: hypothetical protein [Actinomadura]|uniref:Uncharacterized protein n=1 Tax=Actinomadura madurae TaxID=1993 RepID=A0A1I5ELH1_9ACTN|nr:hypothetical protein [Actinomadura madurae]MCP9952800.1 hypothetical protein [Actinomadura madurae]MCP9969563.1 hypothetical protein [Actinomadura madurae]MCP9982021.1 hypothetical protein [Actinomadura madurae]MCQ0006452.1 hypothetical protein [Actinomadura madurae]URM98295.1 hypothetical protein LUW76_30255 [Actinomadura madurae]
MGLILRLIVAAGLAADAIVHWKFAPDMAFVQGGSIDGDLLFRIQAAVAGVVAVIILTYATRWSYALAFLVAASAVGALVLYYYVDMGALGPLPDMYEPVWYMEKTVSLAGEGGAALAALVGFFTVKRGRRREDDEVYEREPAGSF